jgi:hypothetical protein
VVSEQVDTEIISPERSAEERTCSSENNDGQNDEDSSCRQATTIVVNPEDVLTTDDNQQEQSIFDVFGKWIEDVSDQGNRFLKERVFNQKEAGKEASDPFGRLFASSSSSSSSSDENKSIMDSMSNIAQTVVNLIKTSTVEGDDNKNGDSKLVALLNTAREITGGNTYNKQRDLAQIWDLFRTSWGEMLQMLQDNFGHVNLDKLTLLGMWYYVEYEDTRKTPSYKRRMHRYHKKLDPSVILELHNALYLSQLSYADSLSQIQHYLQGFLNNTFELIYCSTEAFPGEPAHFMAIQKEFQPLIIRDKNKLWFPWKKKQETYLEIIMVVRGTKELGDLLSDGLLEASDFVDGKAHAGIAKAGQYLVTTHLDTLRKLWKVSERDKIRLTLVGHSLGEFMICQQHFNNNVT